MEKKETTLRNEAFEVQSRYSFGLASKVFLASTFNVTCSFNFQPRPNQDSKYKRWQLKRKKLPRLNLRHKQENKFKWILAEKWEIVQVKFCASISSTSFWMCARECVCVLGRVRVWVGLWGRLGVCVWVWVCVWIYATLDLNRTSNVMHERSFAATADSLSCLLSTSAAAQARK